ncbi:MAG TPA: nuclear transport factor 2 family protein [Candidatus Acidoferrales bacterium]|nr:nuclear transport factor 2 family protein [Candidatus Acidoferrales bacterium]
MKNKIGRFAYSRPLACAFAALLFFIGSSAIWAGQKNKNSKDKDNSGPLPEIPMSVSDQIDHDIGEMLGAFQVGDVEAMHKYYSDNATFVSGVYAPPVVGWKNYVALYESEKAAFPGMQLIRRNTFIFVHGDVSWASYQWEFDSTLNGKPFTARGQTTLVLTKVGDNWLIVHNHTSEICPQLPSNQVQSKPQAPASSAAPQSTLPKP